jgi:hypothetical protein
VHWILHVEPVVIGRGIVVVLHQRQRQPNESPAGYLRIANDGGGRKRDVQPLHAYKLRQ